MEYIVMKPSEKQKKICELIKSTASFWMNSNDIDSPTHVNDIEEEVYNLDDDIDLDDVEKEILISNLLNIYWVVKKYRD